jgi:transposase
MALAMTRTDLSADELRRATRRSKDPHQARWLLALALVLEGASRTEAARAAGIDRQTLRDWVTRRGRSPG